MTITFDSDEVFSCFKALLPFTNQDLSIDTRNFEIEHQMAPQFNLKTEKLHFFTEVIHL